jgi:NAD(P)H-hydrate epimerase
MAEVDRAATEDFGVSLLQMMEQAGSHLTEVVRLEGVGDLRDVNVVVAVGPGNNGGGGLVAARHLANRGASVRVVLSRPALRMSEAARHQLATLIAMGAHCCVATYDLSDDELRGALMAADVIVDAVLGYRIHDAPSGEEERLIDFIVGSSRRVVSLDVPSGVDPDTGTVAGTAVAASATLTLALPKPGLFTGEGPERAGRIYLGDIGIPEALYTGLGIHVGHPFSAGRIVLLDGSA